MHNSASCFRFGWYEKDLDTSKRSYLNGPSDFDSKHQVDSTHPTPRIPNIDLASLEIDLVDEDVDNTS